jgi:hypothetical protein
VAGESRECVSSYPIRRGPSHGSRRIDTRLGEIDRFFPAGGESIGVYLVRVLRGTAGEVREVLRARTPTHARLRDRLVGIALATIGIDVVCAVLAFLFEHHQKQTQISSFGSALFWTSTQLLTVSSSLQNPISAPGRILDVVMEIYAITVVGALAGALGAFLVKRGEELDQPRRPSAH